MKKILPLILLTLSVNSYALNIVPSNSNYYYQLGGGSDISMPPVTDQQEITIGGDVNTNLGFTCNGFNPAISISNTFNNMKESIEGLRGDIVDSATAAVGTLPMYILEKASPELYNLLQNTIINAQDRFHISMKSCQDSLNEIKNDKSPYQDWFSVSDSQGWLNYSKAAQQGQDVDINNSVKQIAKNPQKYGMPWVHKGQNSGGSQGNQMPIKVISDVVIAGYNVLLNADRALDDQSPAPHNSQLARYWQTPKQAGNWAQLVLGDITISAKNDTTHSGVGLTTIMQTCPAAADNDLTCVKNIAQKLTQIVATGDYPSGKDLQTVSSNELLITPKIINALRNMTQEQKDIAISKISEDTTIQNLIDEALMLRRILIAGSQTKPVHNFKIALTTIHNTIDILDQDIKNVLFEHNIRQQITTNTAENILALQQNSKLQAGSENNKTQSSATEQGAIYK